MHQRIRKVLGIAASEKLSGRVEVVETFIGGKAENTHKAVRERKFTGRCPSGKTSVMSILERKHSTPLAMVPSRHSEMLEGTIREEVTDGAAVYTDELQPYAGLGKNYAHQVINYAER